MSESSEPLQPFNLKTMSGVFPGSRTQIYQRLRLYKHYESPAQAVWTELRWYSEPPVAALWLATNPSATPGAPGFAPAPILQMGDPLTVGDFVLRLHYKLEDLDLQAEACFACRFWQRRHATNPDGIPVGQCTWGEEVLAEGVAMPPTLSMQSALSLACDHFQPASPRRATTDAAVEARDAPNLHLLTSAALDPDRLPFWPRLWHRLRYGQKRYSSTQAPTVQWLAQIVERSGVGAGTEPCFVCQGRLANLGALAVESAEGDKQTLSIWRCRSCHTTYFNDWTDRWERLESLETEERYFRIVPADAFAALYIIQHTTGGDHPGRHSERRQPRAQLMAMIVGRAPLSHQIRQGR